MTHRFRNPSSETSLDAQGSADVRFARREFLRFLASSPILLSTLPAAAAESLIEAVASDADVAEIPGLLATPADAVNVFDFEAVAKQNLRPAHYTYLSMGIQDEFTLRANREAFGEVQLRPRRLVDVRDLDMSTEVLGTKLSCPIVLAPAGSQKAFHPEAELAVARAAKRMDHLQILSTGSSTDIDEVAEARGAPIWFQLYTSRHWPFSSLQLREAEQAGCPVVVLTVDQIGLGRNRDALHRYHRRQNPECQACHQSLGEKIERGADAIGIDMRDVIQDSMVLDWDVVDRIREETSMKLVIKGILTHEDARLCVEHGVDGIVVSNHGGRAEDSGLASIEALPEVVAAVQGRIPILIDSGFRRGTDVFKALALGASAVCIGRPYLWGLAAFGQDGVEAVLAILRRELETIMTEMGTPNLAVITPAHVRRRQVREEAS
jgi:isopentenyl diphosphate isomerase/L-lactate dehydrogenase-like FMN-dependent dehydrogenase